MAGLKGKLLKAEAGEGKGAERDVMERIIPLVGMEDAFISVLGTRA
jgi:hypothetical protein